MSRTAISNILLEVLSSSEFKCFFEEFDSFSPRYSTYLADPTLPFCMVRLMSQKLESMGNEEAQKKEVRLGSKTQLAGGEILPVDGQAGLGPVWRSGPRELEISKSLEAVE